MTETKSMIVVQNVSRGFEVGGEDLFWALKHINMEIPKGKLTILKGRSGSGKTTLMNILSALDQPTEGMIWLGEHEITKMSEGQRTYLRRKEVGYIFQSVALIPMMTAYENVEFSLRLAGYDGNWKERVTKCLHMVGLGARMQHMPQELSGGEQQRVAIARAVAHQPAVLFADEPTAELDTNTGLQVMKIFKDLCRDEGVTVIMTTHDTGLMEIGDQVYELEDGEIIG